MLFLLYLCVIRKTLKIKQLRVGQVKLKIWHRFCTLPFQGKLMRVDVIKL